MPNPQSPSFFLRTYGCQMNERDSEALACLLEQHGYRRAADEATADILLFNTCSVRDQAERKAIGKIGFMKRLKRDKPELIIGVVGCMAQNHGEHLLEQLPHVDLVVGTDRLHELPAMLAEIRAGERGLVRTGLGDDILGALQQHAYGKITAFVAVMRGCNQFCTYCIVPHVRGREKSQPVEAIVDEVQTLIDHGTREIFLLGQNITAYGLAELHQAGTWTPQASPFANLLKAVNDIPGLQRLRFTSPHPKFLNAAALDAITTLPKVCESFHLPLQSGSDRILKAMRRQYQLADYLAAIDAIRARLPQATFSTDIIVGFPGESEADFQATREAMNQVGFDMAYIFKYSPRTGTQAANWPDDVPQEIKEARNQTLLADLERRVASANRRWLGQTVEVLVEGESKRNPDRWTGRTRTNKVCLFTPRDGLAPGHLANLHIDRVTANSLFGTLCIEH